MSWKEIKEEFLYMGIVFFFLWGIPFLAVATVICAIIYAGVSLLKGC